MVQTESTKYEKRMLKIWEKWSPNGNEKALDHFQRAKINDWQERSLYCLYKTEQFEKFKSDLDNIIQNKKNASPFLATLSSHHALNFKTKDKYNFCSSPLDFAEHMSIKELADPNSTLLKELLKDIEKEEISKRTQSRLHHGTQSSGNLFKRPEGSFKTLSKLIAKAIEDYFVVDPQFYRPAEVEYLKGKPNKAEKNLDWKREVSFTNLVHRMVESDINAEEKRSREIQKVRFIP